MTERVWSGRLAAFIGILLIALSLRTPVAALSPILDQIGGEIALDPVVLGLIGAAPPVAFAASGFLAPWLARRFGLERTVFASLVTMVLGHLGRALVGDSTALAVTTLVTLAGVGVGNVLLPSLVRRYFPDRIGLLTALYAAVLSISTAAPALLAVPVADTLGWRWSLGIWVVIALIAAVPWIAALRRGPESGTGMVAATGVTRMARSRTAWALGVIFGVSSFTAYAGFAWLPSIVIDRAQVDPATAGQILAVFAIMGLPTAILVPVLASRRPRSVSAMVVLGALFFAAGALGLLVAPAFLPWLWAASSGLGCLLFPLALVLINLRSRTPSTTVALSGFVQTVGYILGAIGPFALGVLHDVTGTWDVPLAVMLAMSFLLLPAAAWLVRERFVDDEL